MPRAMANRVPHGKSAMEGDPTMKPPLTGQTVGGGSVKVNEEEVFLPIKERANNMPENRKRLISREIGTLRTEVTHALGEAVTQE
jgi:hypothetical protein